MMMMIIEMIRSWLWWWWWWWWWWSRWSWDLELTCPCHVKVRSRPLPTSFPHKSNDSVKIVMMIIMCTIITPPSILFWKTQKITYTWDNISSWQAENPAIKKLLIIKVPDLDDVFRKLGIFCSLLDFLVVWPYHQNLNEPRPDETEKSLKIPPEKNQQKEEGEIRAGETRVTD